MQITIHRGTHQIGGCVTEIKTAQARIIIDIGAELPSADMHNSAPLEISGVTYGEADCDGVFVTHYHGDHVGMCEKVLPTIPMFMGAVAKQIYAVVQRTVERKIHMGNSNIVENFKTFEAGKPIFIKDLKITPYSIDHSAFDAYMFLIEADGKRVLHTGDFRMHGARGRKMPGVFEKYAGNIDVLITEGTMMTRLEEAVITERELGIRAKEIMRDNKSVFALCSSTNIDTIAELYSAAIANRRLFIVCEDDFQLEILRIVTQNSKSSFYNFERRKIYVYGKNLHDYMAERGFCFLCRANSITQRALEAFPQNTLIYSMWDGYINKSHKAYDEYKGAFIDNAIAAGSRLERLHTSGHASANQIKQVCDITNARIIIPIHSENPGAFAKLGVKGKVIILKDGESFWVN